MRERTPDEVEREVTALLGRGLVVAGRYLANEIRRVISVPAPRVRVVAGPNAKWVPPGTYYWRAATPTIPGAPPRRLSGRLRASIDSWEAASFVANRQAAVVRVGSLGVVYAAPLETWMNHPYLLPTLARSMDAVRRIVGQECEFRGSSFAGET